MLVVTLVLAGVGFALLIVALTTGSVVWAWACIAICIAGAVLLLVSALTGRKAVPLSVEPQLSSGSQAPQSSPPIQVGDSTTDADGQVRSEAKREDDTKDREDDTKDGDGPNDDGGSRVDSDEH